MISDKMLHSKLIKFGIYYFLQILVWHTQTVDPKMKQERRLKALGMASDPNIEI